MNRPPDPGPSGSLTLLGKGTSPGLACGPLLRNASDLDPDEARGAILVAERAVPDDVGRILAAAGTLTGSGTVLSHISLLSREFGKPSVALGAAGIARILPPDPGAPLLELRDVVGTPLPPVLYEGDIVFVDGSRGSVEIPGGLDLAARERVRRAFDSVRAIASHPDDDALFAAVADTARGASDSLLRFVLEAGVVHRILPAGAAPRRMVGALSGLPGLRAAVEAWVAETRSRVIAEVRDRCAREHDASRFVEDFDDLERGLRAFTEDLDRARSLLEDLGADRSVLDADAGPILAEAEIKRTVLRDRLAAEVSAALRLPAESMHHRLGGLHRLARRAGAAGVAGREIDALRARLAGQTARERADVGGDLVVPFPGETRCGRSLVGGKAHGLLAIQAVLPSECRIPRGFVVTSSAYRLHLAGERGERLFEAARGLADEAALARSARAILLSGELPDEVVDAVKRHLEPLGSARLAVRSSATAEDGPTGSFAGLFDTQLGVRGIHELLRRIRLSWASLWSARALRALRALGFSPLQESQATLVQEMVETRSAGVLFSRDPAGRPDALLVNATWGLGEAISQGEVPGDLFWVRRSTGEVIATEPGKGAGMVVLDSEREGTREIPLPADLADRPCLSADELGRLAELARCLEEATGRAQDVEFGFDEGDRLVVFQVRRIVSRRRN